MTAPERPKRNPALYTDGWFDLLTDGKPDEALDKFEEHVQAQTIVTLRNIGIRSTVKRDKFSLPWTHEVVTDLQMDSCTNVVYQYQWPLRAFLKELLTQNEDRIRFYLWVDYYEIPDSMFRGGLRYHFRYSVHTPPPPKCDEVPCSDFVRIVPKER